MPTTSKGKIRVEIEALFANAAKHGVQTIILRAGDFFGADGRSSWLDQAIFKDAIKKGVFTAPGKLDTVHAFAYLPDLGAAFAALGEKAESLQAFEVFHFTGHNITLQQLHAAGEAAVGKKLKISFLPWAILAVMGLFMPIIRALREMRYLWQVPHRLVDPRLAEVIGPLPTTPLNEAVRMAVLKR